MSTQNNRFMKPILIFIVGVIILSFLATLVLPLIGI